MKISKILLISPCHPYFGGWYRTRNISRSLGKLGTKVHFVHNKRHFVNPLVRLTVGVRNAFMCLGNDVIYVFELVTPESAVPFLFCKFLRKKVIVDLGDEWFTSKPKGLRKLAFIFERYWKRHHFLWTVTSEFLARTVTGRVLKLINGVDTSEFVPFGRGEARRFLGLSQDIRIAIAFGNTMGGERQRMLNDLENHLDSSIQVWKLSNLNTYRLSLWLGACDIVLFPTGSEPNEKACFPIRVGTTLNAGRVIATDDSFTEFYNTLVPFGCLVTGISVSELAENILDFIKNKGKKEDNVLKAKDSLDWDKLGEMFYEWI